MQWAACLHAENASQHAKPHTPLYPLPSLDAQIDVPPDRTIAGSVRWADPDYELGHEVEGAVVQAW